MVNKTPRAARRRKDRALRKAKNMVVGEQIAKITADQDVLYLTIGQLTVERDYWKKIAEGDDGSQLSIATGLAQQAATELAEEAADAGLTPEEQAAEDAEMFPELQDTEGETIREEGEALLVSEDPPGPTYASEPESELTDEEEPHFDEP